MPTDATPERLGFPDAPAIPTSDLEIQRVRAVVFGRLAGAAAAPVRVGRFTILERVGQGAMGVVYAAYDAELDRKVAIKILSPSDDDRAVRVRLLPEAQAMARLSHPNVIGVYEIGEHDGCGFVAMEFVQGRTLRQWSAETPRTQREIVEHYAQAGRGLAAAHSAGVVHRDFKPDNVLVGVGSRGDPAEERVRVVDFGLARTQTSGSSPLDTSSDRAAETTIGASPATHVGVRKGTPAYMAPEQILGGPADARSDQFAFCIALWEALVGKRPFAGATSAEVFEAVLAGTIQPPPRGTMPAWIEAVLRRGLAPKPEDRYASMDDLLRALATDPRRRRRRILAMTLAVAAVPAALVGLHMRDRLREQACETTAAAIDEVWNDGAKTRVSDAFMATGVENAASTMDKLSPQMTAHAESWRAAALATCTAVEIDRTLDAMEAERATACLEKGLDAERALVEELEQANGIMVGNAVDSALRLPSPTRCTDARALALDLPPPGDATMRAELRRIEGEVQAAEMLNRLGREDEAIDRLTPLVEAADALQWAAIQGVVRYHLALLHNNLNHGDPTRELAETAYLASSRAGDDANAAMSASLLLFHFGVRAMDPERARHWDDLARVAIERAGDRAPTAERFHAVTKARVAGVAGDYDVAEEELRRALAVGEELYGFDHLFLSNHLLALADALCVREAFAECRATAQRAYDIRSRALGDDHPQTARALAELGFATHRGGDSTAALRVLDKAQAIDERHYGPQHYNVAVDLSYRAVVLQETGAGTEAVAALERAVPIMQATFGPEHPEVELLLGNLGRAHETAGDLPAARAALERALAMHTRNGNTKESIRTSNETSLARVDAELQARKERGR